MLKRPELDEAGQQLLAVADYIEQHGWCQHRYHDDEKVCILGAFRNLYRGETTPGALKLASRLPTLIKLASRLPTLIVTWNDSAGRTKQEVIDKLREVAYNPV